MKNIVKVFKTSLLVFMAIAFFAACKKDDCSSGGNPGCIDDIIQSQSDHLLAIKRMDVGGEYHYWLNTGDNAWDGAEYIVNESCDTVCVFCFCPYDPCLDAYQSGEWEVIWEP